MVQFERGFKLVLSYYDSGGNSVYFSWGPPLSGAVEYKIGEWTVPLQGCGPLAVFDSVASLLRFHDTRMWNHDRVFEAEYIRSIERVMWVDIKHIHLPERHTMVTKKMTRADLPAGTILASQVRLLREIKLDGEPSCCVQPASAQRNCF